MVSVCRAHSTAADRCRITSHSKFESFITWINSVTFLFVLFYAAMGRVGNQSSLMQWSDEYSTTCFIIGKKKKALSASPLNVP